MANSFEQKLLEVFGEKKFQKIQSVKIGIAGAGGLGSNCAFNLVRAGFKNFCIVDFDLVEFSNLNRQFYFYDQKGMKKVEALSENLKRINPDISLEVSDRKIERNNIDDLFADCDVVVEAFDKAEYKSIFVEHFLKTDKFIVSASGLCGIGQSDEIKTHQIKKNFVLIGDLKTDSEENSPLSPRVNIAAAKQADAVLEHVLSL
ncbi:MAG: sulfur carrier protein ThiS adenylyltransferase ThiF [Candidatus Omnitrophica bacterium]|nr:sulfur carrier protein ThiS adenylyltransferase ThiF [Candidatus Omnitrophota bacterium]